MSEREDIQLSRGLIKPLTIGAHSDLVDGLWQSKLMVRDAVMDGRELAEFITGDRPLPDVKDPEGFIRTMAKLWLERYGEFAQRSS